MHDGMPYGWNQGQGQRHSREVDRHSPTGLILSFYYVGSKLFSTHTVTYYYLILCFFLFLCSI